MISKAPEEPRAKKEWADQMLRVQVAMWVDDGAKCAVCQQIYASVDDFLARNPRAGPGLQGGKDWNEAFIDDMCWPQWVKRHG
jgi:hypothetical protein